MIQIDPVTFTPETLYEANHKASEAATEAAGLQAEYDRLVDASEDILARLKSKLEEKAGGKVSEARLDRLARCLPEWTEHVNELERVRERYYISKTEAKNGERSWQTIQSAISYLKELVKRDVGSD